jgi:hypothetical protein
LATKNKARGNAAEAAFVKAAEAVGLQAKRAWGSDGRAMGEHEEVDVKVDLPSGMSVLMQIKRRKSVAEYVLPGSFVHVQGLYQDGLGSKRKRMVVVMDAETYFDMLLCSDKWKSRLERDLDLELDEVEHA